MSYLKLKINKLLLLVAVVFSLSFLFPVAAFASPFNTLCTSGNLDGRGLAGQNAICSDVPSSNPLLGPGGLLIKVTNIVTVIAGIAAVIMIIIGGLQFVLSGGDSKRAESARNTILYSVVGLVVIVLARFIIEFVVSRIG